eukprot:6189100-Pleurochrysis_carterae.AAC.2
MRAAPGDARAARATGLQGRRASRGVSSSYLSTGLGMSSNQAASAFGTLPAELAQLALSLRAPALSVALQIDLAATGLSVSSLPADVAGMHKAGLAGPFLLQLVGLWDITETDESRRDRAGDATLVSDSANRTLKLHLTDGLQNVYAMEYKRIAELSTGERYIAAERDFGRFSILPWVQSRVLPKHAPASNYHPPVSGIAKVPIVEPAVPLWPSQVLRQARRVRISYSHFLHHTPPVHRYKQRWVYARTVRAWKPEASTFCDLVDRQAEPYCVSKACGTERPRPSNWMDDFWSALLLPKTAVTRAPGSSVNHLSTDLPAQRLCTTFSSALCRHCCRNEASGAQRDGAAAAFVYLPLMHAAMT